MIHVTGHHNQQRAVQVALRLQVADRRPTAQQNDTVYQKLLADLYLALLGDASDSSVHTRGGNAITTRIMTTRPIARGDFEEDVLFEKFGKEFPFVGVLAAVEIDYQHLRGNLYG